MSRVLKIGESCTFFPGGDLNQKPAAAVCVDMNSQGAASLYVLPANGGEPFFKKNVYHHTNPVLKKNPTLKVQGTWDLVGEHEGRLAAAEAVRKAAQEKAEKDREKERKARKKETPQPTGA